MFVYYHFLQVLVKKILSAYLYQYKNFYGTICLQLVSTFVIEITLILNEVKVSVLMWKWQ